MLLCTRNIHIPASDLNETVGIHTNPPRALEQCHTVEAQNLSNRTKKTHTVRGRDNEQNKTQPNQLNGEKSQEKPCFASLNETDIRVACEIINRF